MHPTIETLSQNNLGDFPVLLLDMNHTFMFEFDNFSESENYYGTYQKIGGALLDESTLNQCISKCHQYMNQRYESPPYYDDFPAVEESIRATVAVTEAIESEMAKLILTFAHHEMGVITEEYQSALRKLAQHKQLGIISNLWAPKKIWLDLFQQLQIEDLFDVIVFSSDSRHIKPSTGIFSQALDRLDCPSENALMIGDSQRCDIGGATNSGIKSVWLSLGRELESTQPLPSWIAPDLLEIAKLLP